MKRGQQVVAHTHTAGAWRMCIPATFLRKLPDGRVRVRDNAGALLDLPASHVYRSQEAFEAAIPNLRVSVNTETGRITEF